MRFLYEYNQMRFTNRWNWNLEMLVFMEGGKPGNPEKNPRSKDENQKQTQPTYNTGTGNRTRATLVESECSHHYAIPAPQTIDTSNALMNCTKIIKRRINN